MILKSILFFNFFTLILSDQQDVDLFDKNSLKLNFKVKDLFETITSTGLHIHFITELNNIVNLFVSEISISQQIPCTAHNIYPKTISHIYNKNEHGDNLKHRNLTKFKSFSSLKIINKFNSYSSIITIVLPEFKNLPSISLRYGTIDFDAKSEAHKFINFEYLKNEIVRKGKILLKTQITIFRFGFNIPKSQDMFRTNNYKFENKWSPVDYIGSIANYFLINIKKNKSVDVYFLCLYCDQKEIVTKEIKITMMTHNNINNYVYENFPLKIINYYPDKYFRGQSICSYYVHKNKEVFTELYCDKTKNITFQIGAENKNTQIYIDVEEKTYRDYFR